MIRQFGQTKDFIFVKELTNDRIDINFDLTYSKDENDNIDKELGT